MTIFTIGQKDKFVYARFLSCSNQLFNSINKKKLFLFQASCKLNLNIILCVKITHNQHSCKLSFLIILMFFERHLLQFIRFTAHLIYFQTVPLCGPFMGWVVVILFVELSSSFTYKENSAAMIIYCQMSDTCRKKSPALLQSHFTQQRHILKQSQPSFRVYLFVQGLSITFFT